MARPPLPEGPYLVVGLARSGIAAASALQRLGQTAIGVDSGTPKGAEQLLEQGVEVHTNSDGLSLLSRVGAVVKSPGVPQSAPAIVGARAQGLPVMGELELGWRMLPNRTIAVTGTNGKTTTVELIAHVHREAGAPVAAAGNVGLALSALCGRVQQAVTVVCEASSFQLEDTLDFAPEVAVLLNIAPDHLDRHASFEEYVQAKLRIFARQREETVAVLPAETEGAGADADSAGLDTSGGPIATAWIESQLRRLGGRARVIRFGSSEHAQARVGEGALWWQGERLLETDELRILGAHNIRNALAAAAACLESGLELDAVRTGLRSFRGVRHRLEALGRRHGVSYVNDSKATNLASTLVALRALSQGQDARRIHLIAGGQGKGQDFTPLRAAVAAACAGVYLIGEDAATIAAALEGLPDLPVERCGELEQAVRRASAAARQAIASARWVSAARQGARAASAAAAGQVAQGRAEQVVLLAPGCASFDQFEDFEARGERFRALVAEL